MQYQNDIINKIICDDCVNILPYIPDNSIDLIIADPPYLTTNELWDKKEVFNEIIIKEFYRILSKYGSIYIWCGIGEKSQSLIRWFPLLKKYLYFKDLITWKKQRGIGMRKGWLYTREEIMWFVKDNKNFIWNKEYQYDLNAERSFSLPNNKSKYRRFTNVWIDIKENSNSMESNKYHWCEKPFRAIERIINLHTKEGDIVLDSFLGSGITTIVCKKLKRRYIGIEINKQYYETILERMKLI